MTNATHQKVTPVQIAAMCRRGFGSEGEIESIQEVIGGTVNETYRIGLVGGNDVILRIAPPDHADTYWDDVALMRREYHIQPHFASIASLMPKVLLADFTHQIIERDYMFQNYIAGENWSDIEDELTDKQALSLWQQCGKIVKQMHATSGERFGYPHPGRQFPRWSDVIYDRLDRIRESMLALKMNVPAFRTITDFALTQTSLLDEIDTPRLLHGDLWTFNLIVQRDSEQAIIAGVIDADRAWWGDPLADWILFLLLIRQEESEWQAIIDAFHEGYGKRANDRATHIRQELYRAMHIGSASVWGVTNGDTNAEERAHRELSDISRTLAQFSA